MDKITFIQYLTELDASDLDLARQKRNQQTAAAWDAKARGQFGHQMSSTSPSKGDIIQANGNRFMVTNMSPDGIHVKQLGGDRTATVQHGTKFKLTGKMPGGKPVFEIIK